MQKMARTVVVYLGQFRDFSSVFWEQNPERVESIPRHQAGE